MVEVIDVWYILLLYILLLLYIIIHIHTYTYIIISYIIIHILLLYIILYSLLSSFTFLFFYSSPFLPLSNLPPPKIPLLMFIFQSFPTLLKSIILPLFCSSDLSSLMFLCPFDVVLGSGVFWVSERI